MVDRSGDTCFIVLGDTGEQDASQFVVCPALSAAVRAHRPGFVLIMSDVIYPAGDVDDYRDGLYRPYRSDDPNFRVAAPLLALPGNHDWYDGLAGFMYHFCGRDRLPPEAYAPGFRPSIALRTTLPHPLDDGPVSPDQRPRSCGPRRHPTQAPSPADAGHRAARSLLRDPHRAPADRRHRHRHRRQIDQAQWDWLTMVSAEPVPKILLTGKPLVVNATLEPCWVGSRPKRGSRSLGLAAGQRSRQSLRGHHRRRSHTTSSATHPRHLARADGSAAAPGRRLWWGVHARHA